MEHGDSSDEGDEDGGDDNVGGDGDGDGVSGDDTGRQRCGRPHPDGWNMVSSERRAKGRAPAAQRGGDGMRLRRGIDRVAGCPVPSGG